jgi:hypothetical protein
MIRFIHHFNYPSGVSRGDGEAWYLGTHVPLIRELPGVLRYRSWRQIEVGISYPSAGLLRKITALPVPAGLVIRQSTNCFFHTAFDLVARSAHYTVLLVVKTIARPALRFSKYICVARSVTIKSGRCRVGLVPEAQIVLDRAHARNRARYHCGLQVPRLGRDGPSQPRDAVPHLQADVSELMLVESLPDLALQLVVARVHSLLLRARHDLQFAQSSRGNDW